MLRRHLARFLLAPFLPPVKAADADKRQGWIWEKWGMSLAVKNPEGGRPIHIFLQFMSDEQWQQCEWSRDPAWTGRRIHDGQVVAYIESDAYSRGKD